MNETDWCSFENSTSISVQHIELIVFDHFQPPTLLLCVHRESEYNSSIARVVCHLIGSMRYRDWWTPNDPHNACSKSFIGFTTFHDRGELSKCTKNDRLNFNQYTYFIAFNTNSWFPFSNAISNEFLLLLSYILEINRFILLSNSRFKTVRITDSSD